MWFLFANPVTLSASHQFYLLDTGIQPFVPRGGKGDKMKIGTLKESRCCDSYDRTSVRTILLCTALSSSCGGVRRSWPTGSCRTSSQLPSESHPKRAAADKLCSNNHTWSSNLSWVKLHAPPFVLTSVFRHTPPFIIMRGILASFCTSAL